MEIGLSLTRAHTFNSDMVELQYVESAIMIVQVQYYRMKRTVSVKKLAELNPSGG